MAASGAMVFGGVAQEHLQLNEDTIWAGSKRDRSNPDGNPQRLPRFASCSSPER
jgi:hypothetical protein